ncbi:DDB1- and CUL4-associated factor 8 [Cichlidogyrus casuarinus]|uniref:DDB1- and CUL4-associated factor 8 n=1 Tax=Cichlidogyrus casuarinus TaxID=1844966 RepID=A0ABD2Q703_9PLAT
MGIQLVDNKLRVGVQNKDSLDQFLYNRPNEFKLFDALYNREYFGSHSLTKQAYMKNMSCFRCGPFGHYSSLDAGYGNLSMEEFLYGSLWTTERMDLESVHEPHTGCINSLRFNDFGDKIISGSDDTKIAMTDWFNQKLLTKFSSGHVLNVFQCHFVPESNDLSIVTSSQDGQVRLAILRPDGSLSGSTKCLAGHKRPCHKLNTLRDTPNVVLSAGEDGVVYSIDLRDEAKKIVNLKWAMFCGLATNPVNENEFCVSSKSDVIVRVYDRRFLVSKGIDSGYVDCFYVPDLLPSKANKLNFRYRVSENGVRSRLDPPMVEKKKKLKTKKNRSRARSPSSSSSSTSPERGNHSPDIRFAAHMNEGIFRLVDRIIRGSSFSDSNSSSHSHLPRETPVNDYFWSKYNVTNVTYSNQGDGQSITDFGDLCRSRRSPFGPEFELVFESLEIIAGVAFT